jgi:diguanylate cyclase (GGDEF)-like protein
VIFYSAVYAINETMAMARSCGVRTVLSKPSEPQAIVNAVNAELGLAAGLAPQFDPQPDQELATSLGIAGRLVPGGSAADAIAALVARHGGSAALASDLGDLFNDRMADMHRIAARLTALEEMSLRLVGERSPRAMVDAFVRAASHIVDADYVALCLLDSGETSARHLAACGVPAAVLEPDALDRCRLPASLLLEKHPLRCHAFDGMVSGLPEAHPPVGTFLGLAVRDQNHLYGWMYCARKPGAPPFTREDERIATTLATQLSVAYQNLVLYEVVQRHAAQLQLEATAREQADAALRASRRQLDFLSNHDALTLLPNRAVMNERLQAAITAARGSEHQIAVLLFNLDRLQRINDSLGHETGDAMLREMARRASALAGRGDTLAHLGSDEFVLLLAGCADLDEIVLAARRLIDEVALPVQVGGHDLILTASVGISIYPRDGGSPSELLKAADVALSHMKEAGRNGFRFFKGEMNEHALRSMSLETHLRRAIERDELSLHYQPQVALDTGRICGMEALLRWKSPELGQVAPCDFIPLAEDTGLIMPIGTWVLRQACLQNKAWQDAGLPQLRVAVNVSAVQIAAGTLPAIVRDVLQESGMAACHLEIELTESVMMHDTENTEAQLAELAGMGVSVALDDFGTGYSSLGYLSRFRLDKLKIDQTFVRDITSEPRSAAIAQATAALGHGLSLVVTAEGVETEGQLEFLRKIGCDQVQGYLLSRPVPATQMALLLAQPSLLPSRIRKRA